MLITLLTHQHPKCRPRFSFKAVITLPTLRHQTKAFKQSVNLKNFMYKNEQLESFKL